MYAPKDVGARLQYTLINTEPQQLPLAQADRHANRPPTSGNVAI